MPKYFGELGQKFQLPDYVVCERKKPTAPLVKRRQAWDSGQAFAQANSSF